MIDEEFQRAAEVGGDLRREVRELLGVLAEVALGIELEPVSKEIGELRLGPRIGHHAARVLLHLGGMAELAGLGGVEQRLVRDRVPDAEGQAGGHGEAVLIRADLRVEEAR